ncbi:hypothetical protein [Methylobacterium aquaticum]|uniref:Uncharacterized protein n=1 Tax=Methylobacterium aquaticum TaxID=270351 RepID=A0A0C6FH30_9HYPH|nr:hypothetical protein [Methylobacterium aquaticum]BAQ44379.1 hypothetical protein Maq22A_c04875 [Methylobacterium aquaticum]
MITTPWLPFVAVGLAYFGVAGVIVFALGRQLQRNAEGFDRRQAEAEARRARLQRNIAGPRPHRITAGYGYDAPTAPASPLYGGHAAPARCGYGVGGDAGAGGDGGACGGSD